MRPATPAVVEEQGWLGLLYRWLLGTCVGAVPVGVGSVVLLATVLPLGDAGRPAADAMPWLAFGGVVVASGPVVGLRVAGLRWTTAVAATALLVGAVAALLRSLA